MRHLKLTIQDMTCNHCVMAVQRALRDAGITDADVKMGMVELHYDETSVTQDQIVRAIEQVGYRVILE